jgi:hypothetical protein
MSNDRADDCGEFCRFVDERIAFSIGAETRCSRGYSEPDVRFPSLLEGDRAFRDEVSSAFTASRFFEVHNNQCSTARKLRGQNAGDTTLVVKACAVVHHAAREPE